MAVFKCANPSHSVCTSPTHAHSLNHFPILSPPPPPPHLFLWNKTKNLGALFPNYRNKTNGASVLFSKDNKLVLRYNK